MHSFTAVSPGPPAEEFALRSCTSTKQKRWWCTYLVPGSRLRLSYLPEVRINPAPPGAASLVSTFVVIDGVLRGVTDGVRRQYQCELLLPQGSMSLSGRVVLRRQ